MPRTEQVRRHHRTKTENPEPSPAEEQRRVELQRKCTALLTASGLIIERIDAIIDEPVPEDN